MFARRFSILFLAASASLIYAIPAQASETLLNFVERAKNDTVTDTGAKGDSAGDILTFANEIYDEANATKLGEDNGWCVRTVPGKAWECLWTVVLAEGQITVEGPFLDGKDSVLAITGGTGKYVDVTGEMALHARNAEGTEYDFKYRLVD